MCMLATCMHILRGLMDFQYQDIDCSYVWVYTDDRTREMGTVMVDGGSVGSGI